jgi:hypothetical protein
VLDGDQGTPALHALEAETARVRGLSFKRPVRFGLLPTETLAQVMRQRAREATPAQDSSAQLWWGLGGLPSGNAGALPDGVPDKPVAFLDRVTGVVWVSPSWDAGGEEAAAGVVHELARALLAQAFPRLRTDKAPNADVRQARTSLVEGDAMLTMMAWLAARQGRTPEQALPGIVAAVAGMPVAGQLRMGGLAAELLEGPAWWMEQRLFPLVMGVQLVAQVFGRGGFSLVNQMYEHPPQTTREVFHPETYLKGFQAVTVAPPVLPEGITPMAAGVLGELGTRGALQACHPQKLVSDVVVGLEGDAWRLGRGKDGKPVMVWVTSWEREKEARMVEFLLHKSVACTGGTGWGVTTVNRRDRVVAWTRGLDEKRAEAFVGQWAGGVGKAVSSTPPLGEVAAPEKNPEGTVRDGVWTSAWLGVSARVPPGYQVQPQAPGVELMLKRQDGPASAVTLAWVGKRLKPAVVRSLFAAMAQRLTGNGPPLSPMPAVESPTPLGPSTQQRFVDGAGQSLTLLAVPWCGGQQGTLVLALLAGDPTGEALVQAFVDGMAPVPDAPACR